MLGDFSFVDELYNEFSDKLFFISFLNVDLILGAYLLLWRLFETESLGSFSFEFLVVKLINFGNKLLFGSCLKSVYSFLFTWWIVFLNFFEGIGEILWSLILIILWIFFVPIAFLGRKFVILLEFWIMFFSFNVWILFVIFFKGAITKFCLLKFFSLIYFGLLFWKIIFCKESILYYFIFVKNIF